MEKIFKFYRKNSQFFKFGFIGACGTIVNTAILWIFTAYFGIYYLISSIIATETAIIFNFLGNNFFTFRGINPLSLKQKFFRFQIVSITTIIGTVSLLWIFTSVFGVSYLVIWNLLAIFLMFLANFFINKRITWRSKNTKVLLFLSVLSIIFLTTFATAGLMNVNTNPKFPLNTSDLNGKINVNFKSSNYPVNISIEAIRSGEIVDRKDYFLNSNKDLPVVYHFSNWISGEYDLFLIENYDERYNLGVLSISGSNGNETEPINETNSTSPEIPGNITIPGNVTFPENETIPDINESNEGDDNETDITIPIPVNESIDEEVNDENSDNGNGNSESSGRSSRNREDSVDLVYVTFSRDVINKNESLSIVLDAKGSVGVESVRALLNGPNGSYIENLTLTNGTKSYGTWMKDLRNLDSGLHSLEHIELKGKTDKSYKKIIVSDRAFYVNFEDNSFSQDLQLIFLIVEENTVDSAKNVSFKLDARDNNGITQIWAKIVAFRGDSNSSIVFPLSLVSGNGTYGTWQGFIEVNQPYTTYSVVNITLKNNETEVSYKIENRSVYATGNVPDLKASKITGFAILDREIRNDPLFPALFGFSVFFVTSFVSILVFKIYKYIKK